MVKYSYAKTSRPTSNAENCTLLIHESQLFITSHGKVMLPRYKFHVKLPSQNCMYLKMDIQLSLK